MKQYILTSLLITLFFCVNAQVYTERSNGVITAVDVNGAFKYGMKIPVHADTTTALARAGKDSIGLMFKEKNSSKVWIRDTVLSGGHKWTLVNGSGGNPTDTVNLKLRIDTIANKLSISMAGLRALNTIQFVGQAYYLTDRYKQGYYYYDPTDGTTADDGAICIVDIYGNRFKRLFSGKANVMWWPNVIPDGTTNCTAGLQAAIDWMSSNSMGKHGLYWPSGISGTGRYMVDSLTFKIGEMEGDNMRTRIGAITSSRKYLIGILPGVSDKWGFSNFELIANPSNTGQGGFNFTALSQASSPFDGGVYHFHSANVQAQGFSGIGLLLDANDAINTGDVVSQFQRYDDWKIYESADTTSVGLMIKGQASQIDFHKLEIYGVSKTNVNTYGIVLKSYLTNNDQVNGAVNFWAPVLQNVWQAAKLDYAQGINFWGGYAEQDSFGIEAVNSGRGNVTGMTFKNISGTVYLESDLGVINFRDNHVLGTFRRLFGSRSGTPGGGARSGTTFATNQNWVSDFASPQIGVSSSTLNCGSFYHVLVNVNTSTSAIINTINANMGPGEILSITPIDQSNTDGVIRISGGNNIDVSKFSNNGKITLRKGMGIELTRADAPNTWVVTGLNQPPIVMSALPTQGVWDLNEHIYNQNPTHTGVFCWVVKTAGTFAITPPVFDSVMMAGATTGGGSGTDSSDAVGFGLRKSVAGATRTYKVDTFTDVSSKANVNRKIDSLLALGDTAVFRSGGATGKDMVYVSGATVTIPKIRDTSARFSVLTPDSAMAIASHDSTSVNALATKAQTDSAKQAIRNSVATKKNNSDSTGPTSYVPRNQLDTMRAAIYAGLIARVLNIGGANGIQVGAYLARPSAPSTGTFYWSTDSVFWSYYNGSIWKDLKPGSSGGGSQNLESVLSTGSSLTSPHNISLNSNRLYIDGAELKSDTQRVKYVLINGDSIATWPNRWIEYWGYSILAGYAQTTKLPFPYADYISQALGYRKIQRAIGGTTLCQRTSADSSFQQRWNQITPYDAANPSILYICSYALNDAQFSDIDSNRYKTVLDSAVNTMGHITKGYPYSQIFVEAGTYYDTTNASYPGGTKAYKYMQIAKRKAQQYGTLYLDGFDFGRTHGGVLNLWTDLWHLNQRGQTTQAIGVLSVLTADTVNYFRANNAMVMNMLSVNGSTNMYGNLNTTGSRVTLGNDSIAGTQSVDSNTMRYTLLKGLHVEGDATIDGEMIASYNAGGKKWVPVGLESISGTGGLGRYWNTSAVPSVANGGGGFAVGTWNSAGSHTFYTFFGGLGSARIGDTSRFVGNGVFENNMTVLKDWKLGATAATPTYNRGLLWSGTSGGIQNAGFEFMQNAQGSSGYFSSLFSPATPNWGVWFGQKSLTDGTTPLGFLWMTSAGIFTRSAMLPDQTATADSVLTTTTVAGVRTIGSKALSSFTGIASLNGLTAGTQTFSTGTSGSDFGISSTSTTHTFNIPDAGASARGLITTGAQTLAGVKTFSFSPVIPTPTAGDNSTKGATTAYVDGALSSISSLKFVETADGTVTNTTGSLSIIGTGTGSNTVAANSLTVGKRVVLRGFANLSTDASAPSLGISFYNSTSNAGTTLTSLLTSSMSNASLEYELYGTIRSTGSSGSIMVSGWFSVNGTKSYISNGALLINTTVTQTFDVLASFGTASTNNTIVSKQHFLTVN